MDELIRYVKKLVIKVGLLPFKILKVKRNRILLINDISYNYSDSSKYIYEYVGYISGLFPNLNYNLR